MKCYEDIAIGETALFGAHEFTETEIIRFAKDHDPQLFHIDHDAAAAGPFGRLTASGWHTAAIWMRLMVAWMQDDAAQRIARGEEDYIAGPSPGFDNMRWIKPVFAGDTLTYRSTVSAKRESKSRPQWGLVSHHNEAVNQNGELVFSFTSNAFMPRRSAPSSAD